MTPFSLVVLMLLFSAFFSGLEIAFLSANRLRIELKSNQGKHWARICSDYFKSPSEFISTILVGNNIALVIYGATMEEIFRPLFMGDPYNLPSFVALILATLISTVIVLTTAEFLPKALFRLNPSGILSILIYPFQFFYYLLWPFVRFVMWLSKKVLRRVFNKDFTEKTPEFTRIDLDHFISQSAQHSDRNEESDVDTDILKNALDFSNVKVRDCLVPRTDIVAVDILTDIDELIDVIISSQHSKILVYEENIDHVIGYVHHIDLQKKPASIESILMPILITNESRSAHDMLNEFSKTQKSIALVVDEYGGTAGVITIEDIMEEIFGEIEDEHDDREEDHEAIELEDGYVFSAKMEVDAINERFDLKMNEGEYETLGGFIVAKLEDIPNQGDIFVIDNFEIEILAASETRIERVKLKHLE
ncbi:MAG: HlyC/CorC family transporter [Bacteroidia bacterium]